MLLQSGLSPFVLVRRCFNGVAVVRRLPFAAAKSTNAAATANVMALLPLPLTISLSRRPQWHFSDKLASMAKMSSRLSFSVSYEDDGNVAFVIVIRPSFGGWNNPDSRTHCPCGWMDVAYNFGTRFFAACSNLRSEGYDRQPRWPGRRALNHLSVSVVRPSDRRVTDIIGDAFGRSR